MSSEKGEDIKVLFNQGHNRDFTMNVDAKTYKALAKVKDEMEALGVRVSRPKIAAALLAEGIKVYEEMKQNGQYMLSDDGVKKKKPKKRR